MDVNALTDTLHQKMNDRLYNDKNQQHPDPWIQIVCKTDKLNDNDDVRNGVHDFMAKWYMNSEFQFAKKLKMIFKLTLHPRQPG